MEMTIGCLLVAWKYAYIFPITVQVLSIASEMSHVTGIQNMAYNISFEEIVSAITFPLKINRFCSQNLRFWYSYS